MATQKTTNSKVLDAKYEDGAVLVKYANGTAKKFTPQVISGGTSVEHDSWKTNGYYGTGTSYSYQADPKKAFEAYDIEFWGMPKSKLDDIIFHEGDLIINCSGTAWSPKPPPIPKEFASQKPDWMNLPQILTSPLKQHNNGELAEQLLLDWADFKSPPNGADFDFWHEIIQQSKENGVKRIICCCFAGQGRTGTALAALLLATEMVDEPDMAIDYIRKQYNSKAVESKEQEEYIFNLIYKSEE